MRPLVAKPAPTVKETIEDKIAAKQKRLKRICDQIEADGRPAGGPFAAKKIIRAVAKAHGITFDEIIGQSRQKHIAIARHHAMWEVRHHTKLSTTVIGHIFDKRDHSTVVSGCKRHEWRRSMQ